MNCRCLLPLAALTAFAVVIVAPARMTGQAAKGKAYKAPRTPWGDPDLQGLWPGSVNIPLQRPANMGERSVLTPEEIAERNAQSKQRAETGTWIEFYPANNQASLVVDPKDGRLPPMTPAAIKRNKEMRDGLGVPTLGSVEQRADSWTDFDLWGRCITKGLIGSMLPGNLYNKGNRIVQGPGYVVIQNEMVHESRVIPLDGRPHAGPQVRTYMGDGRGHWEGDTLVVETTNFLKDIGMNGIGNALLTEELKITERFTRTAQDVLMYDATIEDSGTWTRPWTMHVPYQMEPYDLYEYACHESNYGLPDILKGARADEKRKAGGRVANAMDFGAVRKLALALPDVEESTAYGSPAFKVRGTLLACIAINKSAEPGSLGVRIDFDQRQELLAEAPDVYYVTDHYVNYPMVLVRLSRVRADAMRDLLGGAWRFVTAKKIRKKVPKKK